MGGIILVGLVFLAVILLLTPALRRRAREERDTVAQTAHEAVISRLEDHRRRKGERGEKSDTAPDRHER